jgi:hypothetical protein
LEVIKELRQKYVIYGIKIVPIFCQSKVTELLADGAVFLDLARHNNWPVLLHTTTHKQEEFSRADMAFKVIEANTDVRFCLAHCIGFDELYLDKASEAANVWVDTSALKIQCQLAFENNPVVSTKTERLKLNYSDHKQVIAGLAQRYPETIIWGSDTPAYSFICKRKQADGVFSQFRLKASYGDEVDALKGLDKDVQFRIANRNTLNFLFGNKGLAV